MTIPSRLVQVAGVKMSDDDANPSVGKVIADYLRAIEAGNPPDRDQLISRHPTLDGDLRSFLANYDETGHAARSAQRTLPPKGVDAADRTMAAEDVPAEDATLPPTGPTAKPQELRSGAEYFGDYELIEEIARGGMGVVYKAKHCKLNRIVALKMILGGRFSSDEEVQRFQIEAEAAACLDHPGIVPIYEIGRHEGQHFFAMKFVEGGSLAEHCETVRENRRRAVQMIAKVASAVHHAHQRGILHRDLKPANILLDADGNPSVTDLGLAKNTANESDLTHTGTILGTPSYMPPEQASGSQTLTTAADIYSLGAILYELLTGQPPHQGTTPLETVMQVMDEPIKPPRRLEPKVERDLELICLKCLAREPDSRYASAAALADDLRHWLAGDKISVRPPTTFAMVGQWFRHNRHLVYPIFPLVLGIAFSLPLLLVYVGGDFVEAYEYFPDERPWLYSLAQSPDWVTRLFFLLLLLLWPTVGLLNAIVARPATALRALGIGVFSAFLCTILLSVSLGWIGFIDATGTHAHDYVLALAKVAWPPEPQEEWQARQAALELMPGLESVAEDERAEVLASRVQADGIAQGPGFVLVMILFCLVLVGPVIYGTVVGQLLLRKGNAWWMVALRYFVAWPALTVAYSLVLFEPGEDVTFVNRFNSAASADGYPMWVSWGLLPGLLLFAFAVLRDWKRPGKTG